MLLLAAVGGVKAADVDAKWDWQNTTPASITSTNIQTSGGSTVAGTMYGTVDSNVDGVSLSVYATETGTGIKLQYNSSGYAQFNQTTAIRVPVESTRDMVQVVSYPGQYKYTVGGTAASANETNHYATDAEVTQGYVEIVATGTAYLYAIRRIVFKDIKINLTTWSEGISTTGVATTAYVSVDSEGTATYSTSDATDAVGTLKGYYHGATYGWQNMSATIPVPGYVKITYGTNNYGSAVSITNSAGTEVATINNNSSNIWSTSNTGNVVTTYYLSSEGTTLNFSKCDYVGYFAVEKMTADEIAAMSTNYTLTYYDTDGTTELGTQSVAAGSTIGTFSYTGSEPMVAVGNTLRGWFASAEGGQKYTTETVVTGDLSLYAVATETEVSSDDKTYTFDLTNQYFYAEDHEAFNPSAGSWHDVQHGWTFSNGNTIDLLVGAKAVVSVGICQYSKSGATIQVKKGDEVLATLDGQSATDGTVVSYDYVGEAGTLTLNIVSTGTVYIHNVKIVNYNSSAFTKSGRWYTVTAGSADGFLQALSMVNAANGSTSAERSFIFLPNGTYDLGTTTLTTISGHNVSIIGESRDGVVIKNRPTAEGIGVTATLLNTGTNNYLQDLTLDCIAPWGGSAERGVCLQDKGTKTICKNVYMKGLQDTYYCNNNSGQYYFEDGKIEGTVDYICGNGDVYFNRTLLYNAESSNRSGGDVIAAPNTLNSFGYVFNNCTIDGPAAQAGAYTLGRPWAASTKCLWVNTTMSIEPAAIGWSDWSPANAVALYAEYNSVNGSGTAVDLSGRKTSFNSSANTPVITAAEAAALMPDQVDWADSWQPYELTTQLDAPTVSVSGTTASWDDVTGAAAYALYKNGTFVGITTSTSYTVDGSGTYTLRVANSMGGFGDVTGTTTTVSPTIGATGYATYSSSHALDFGSATGVKAYIATEVEGSGIVMTKVTGSVPAGTGLVLQKDGDGAISIPVVPSATAPASNLLKASVYKSVVAATSGSTYHYVFAKQNGVVGFFNLASATDMPAGKAYLETTTALSSPRLEMLFDDDNTDVVTGIQSVDNAQSTMESAEVYNLNGQRVSQPTKGLYIVNGKKVMVK